MSLAAVLPLVRRYLMRGARNALLRTCRDAAALTVGSPVLRVGVRGGWARAQEPHLSRAISNDPNAVRLLVVRFDCGELERVAECMPSLLRALPGVTKVLLDVELPESFDPWAPSAATTVIWSLSRALLHRLVAECPPRVVFITPLSVGLTEPDVKDRFISVIGQLMSAMTPAEEADAYLEQQYSGWVHAVACPLGPVDRAFCLANNMRFADSVGAGTRLLLGRAFSGSPDLMWLTQPPAVRFLGSQMHAAPLSYVFRCNHVCIGSQTAAAWANFAGTAPDMLAQVDDVAVSETDPESQRSVVRGLLAVPSITTLRLPLRMLEMLVADPDVLAARGSAVQVWVVSGCVGENSVRRAQPPSASALLAALTCPFIRVKGLLCRPVPVAGPAELRALVEGPSTGDVSGMIHVHSGTDNGLVEAALAANHALRLAPCDA